jgi:cytochrome c-type protein NapC
MQGKGVAGLMPRVIEIAHKRTLAILVRAPIVAAVVLFVGGIVAWGAFNTAMEGTNNLSFCISCHAMRSTVYEEYRHTVHFSNPSGVQATCPDCHVPKEWTAKLVRKIRASNEIYHWLAGSISTAEKFEAKRPALAARVWDSMKTSDSRECRNCHNFSAMKIEAQGRFAGRLHGEAVAKGQTCIDCHKGISHRLPAVEMTVSSATKFDPELAQEIYTTCAPCHGRQGQGTPDGVYPRLAGLDRVYLTRQIEQFKSHERINIPMLPYATERELPDSEVRTVVAYLTAIDLPRKLSGSEEGKPFDALAALNQTKAVLNIPLFAGDVHNGRRLYDKECSVCHGRDGYGDRMRNIPQLAGQHSLYLKRQIEAFGKGTRRHDDPADAAIFKTFAANEIADILAYVSTLDDN